MEPTEKSKQSQKIKEQDDQIREYFNMQCELCSHTFQTFLDARAHYPKAHNVTGYLKCCSVKIFRRGKLIEHINYHINPNEFECDQCHKTYSSKKKLVLHQKSHNPNAVREFICNICGKDFLYKEALRKHMMAHVKEEDKKYVCDDCDKRLAFVLTKIIFN